MGSGFVSPDPDNALTAGRPEKEGRARRLWAGVFSLTVAMMLAVGWMYVREAVVPESQYDRDQAAQKAARVASLDLWRQHQQLTLLPGPPPASVSLESLLSRVEQRYATCRTYRDTGLAMTNFGNRVSRTRFKTALVRRKTFRFEWEEQSFIGAPVWQSNGVWRNRNEVRSWMNFEAEPRTGVKFRLAIAGAMGVSGGLAASIPGLLMPGALSGQYLRRLKDKALGSNGSVEGDECYRLQGVVAHRGDTITIWIDVKTLAIRRVDRGVTVDRGHTFQRVVIYRPIFDGEIEPQLLAFNPPK